jgi:hypothetical protein
MTAFDEENLIRRFLLGDLSSDEHDRIEERLFIDENFFALVDALEDELIDDFMQGRMKAEDLERFERNFLTTDERRDRFEFARVFSQALPEFQTSSIAEAGMRPARDAPHGFWVWIRGRQALAAGLASALILISVATVLLWQKLSGRNVQEEPGASSPPHQASLSNDNNRGLSSANIADKEANANAARDNPASERKPTDKTTRASANDAALTEDNQRRRPLAATSFAVVLETGSLRGDGSFTKFSVPKESKTVVLRLRFDNDDERVRQDERYEAELQNGELKTIRRAENLPSRSARGSERVVNLSVPASLVQPGNYQVILRKRGPQGNVESVGSYYFSVSGP